MGPVRGDFGGPPASNVGDWTGWLGRDQPHSLNYIQQFKGLAQHETRRYRQKYRQVETIDHLRLPSSITATARCMTAALASGGRSSPTAIVRLFDADWPAARRSSGDDLGRTFGRLGDLDDTSHANQERHSASRTVEPASTRASARPPVRQARGCSGRAPARSWRSSSLACAERPLAAGRKRSRRSTPHLVFPAGGCMTCAGCLRHGLQRLGVRLEVTEAVLNHLRELGGGPVAALTLRPQA